VLSPTSSRKTRGKSLRSVNPATTAVPDRPLPDPSSTPSNTFPSCQQSVTPSPPSKPPSDREQAPSETPVPLPPLNAATSIPGAPDASIVVKSIPSPSDVSTTAPQSDVKPDPRKKTPREPNDAMHEIIQSELKPTEAGANVIMASSTAKVTAKREEINSDVEQQLLESTELIGPQAVPSEILDVTQGGEPDLSSSSYGHFADAENLPLFMVTEPLERDQSQDEIETSALYTLQENFVCSPIVVLRL